MSYNNVLKNNALHNSHIDCDYANFLNSIGLPADLPCHCKPDWSVFDKALSVFFPMDDPPTRVEEDDDDLDSSFLSSLDSFGISIDDVLQSFVIQEHLNCRKEVFHD